MGHTIEVTEEMWYAISIAFSELDNSDDWMEYYTNEQIEKIYDGRIEFVEQTEDLIEKYGE
jgi:hypothetical protein